MTRQQRTQISIYTQFASSKGYSLLELMIGMSLGLVLTLGVSSMYTQSSGNYQRMSDEVLRIGNTQYVGNVLRKEIQGAGYWGAYTGFETPAVWVDPCSTDLASLEQGVHQPVLGYNSPANSPLACLNSNNHVSGTDILVLRRASGLAVSADHAMVNNDVYIQANPQEFVLEYGNSGGFFPALLNGDNSIASVGTSPNGGAASILIKRNTPDANPVINATRLAADVRKYRTDIYFVAPCTIPSDGSDVCTGTMDDGGEPVPSLKKLELSAQSGNLQFDVVTIAEGVSNMQILYGIDSSDEETPGSGSPDNFIAAPTLVDLNNVVSLQVSLLIRDKSRGEFQNQNTYNLAGQIVGPFNDYYSRQALNSNYRIANLSMRRAGSN